MTRKIRSEVLRWRLNPSGSEPRPRRYPRGRRATAIVGLAMFLSAAISIAQPPLTVGRFDFNFSNPGARSLGFGGAFAALADDATAAFANPAGLVQLARPEVSFEGRLWNRSTSFISGGRLEGEPTGLGIDTRRGLAYGRDDRRIFGPSFAAVVIPKGRWSFALYGHQLARLKIATESQGLFLDDEDNPLSPLGVSRIFVMRERVDLDIVTAGAAAAWRANDRLSFGLGIIYSQTSLDTVSDFFLRDDDSTFGIFKRVSFLPERKLGNSRLSIRGTDLTVNAGVLWSATDRLSVALVYRQGAHAEGTNRLEYPPRADYPFPGLEFPGFAATLGADFQVPDVLGGGLAYRSADGRLTLAGEVDRVGYEDLVSVPESDGVEVGGLEYLDAWEYHVGAEYALLQLQPVIAIRLGGWVETNKDLLARGNRTHLSAGMGFATKEFQIDLAGDFSSEVDTLSLSIVYGF